MKKTICSI